MRKAKGKTKASVRVWSKLTVAVLVQLMILAGVVVSCKSPPNTPPVAAAGGGLTVFAGYPVDLDGSSSTDPEGEELAYHWSILSEPEGSRAELSDAKAVRPTFTPDRLGEYVISLAVNDGESWSLPVYVTVLAKPWFTNVTEEAGVAGPDVIGFANIRNFANPKGISGVGDAGASWGDYDNDGYYDLYVTQYKKGNLLYHNNGDGTFTDVAKEAGVDFKGNSAGAVWGDYDKDGDLDLYLTVRKPPSILYRNNGDGTFTDVTDDAGVGNVKSAAGAAWGDYDNDGYLDLAVATKAGPEFLFRNNGNGTFTNVAPQLNVGQEWLPRDEFVQATSRGIATKSGSTWQAFWFDYNNDGYLDLFFAVDWGTNYLYRNNGDGTFTEVTEEAGIFMLGNGMGVDAGDYDGDGDLDLYVTNFGAAPIAGVGYTRTPNFLFHNNGDGTFSEMALRAGVRGRSGVGWGTHFFDYDNDGDVDLAVANGGWGRYSSRWERETGINLLYRNDGDGTFTDVTEISGLGSLSMTRGLALADYDGDGDLDVFMAESDDRNHLFRNDIANYLGNNWLKIKLKGTESNDFGIGSMVKLTSAGLTLVEQLFAGNSFYSQNPLELHFGLAGEPVVQTIEVRWPSGIVQMMDNIGVNQTITITEAGAP